MSFVRCASCERVVMVPRTRCGPCWDAFDAGRHAERAAILAYLRKDENNGRVLTSVLAAEFERGDHEDHAGREGEKT